MITTNSSTKALAASVVTLAMAALIVCLPLCAGAQEFSCTITAPRPARAFFPGESIYLTVTVSGPQQQATYTIFDYQGRRRIVDTLQVGNGEPRNLSVPFRMPTGIYYITLNFATGQRVNDAFCVIPRPDDEAGEYGIFGFHLGNPSEELVEALAQAGVRIVRDDMDWVNSEPTEGNYSLGKAQARADLYSKYGIQWIPILGYTPGWARMEPENATGRSAAAAHAWAPAETTHWAGFVQLMADYLGSQTVHWPSEEIIPRSEALASEDLPLVNRWEIWNEVDQAFYYGYWGRYLDLLRIAYCTLKTSNPRNVVLYGGSCGHWTELGNTYHANCKYYFDELAFHGGGTDIGKTLEIYYTGAPQIGNGYGIFHPSSHTETYPSAPAPLTETQYMIRLYTTLKKWQERTWCVFYGGRVVGAADPASSALLYSNNGAIVPNAKYVAFAVARWLLSDATYVGPIDLGETVEANLFLKYGRPMLICWSDENATVNIALASDAHFYDEMGNRFPMPRQGTASTVTLTAKPLVIYGVDYHYLSQAIRNQAEIYLTTPQGFETDRVFGYIGPLERDAAWAWSDWPRQFRRALQWATDICDRRPRVGPRALGIPQMVTHGQLYRTVRKCEPAGYIHGPTHHIIYRLECLTEWLGRVADARDRAWEVYNHQSRFTDKLLDRMEQLETRITANGLNYPLAQQSLDCARRQIDRAVKYHHGGAYRAATGLHNTAVLLSNLEQPKLLKVFAVADFITATQLVKGLALPPGVEHNLRVTVYNYTNQPVSGQITWHLPNTWSKSTITKSFIAPAGGYSEPIDCLVTIPDEPKPWVEKDGSTGVGNVTLRLPEPISVQSDLKLAGELDDGRSLLDMHYDVLIGEPVIE